MIRSPLSIKRKRSRFKSEAKQGDIQEIFQNMKRDNQLKLTYTIQKSTHDIMYEMNQEEILNIDQDRCLLMVSMYLPMKIQIQEAIAGESKFNITFPKNNNNNLLYLDLIKKYTNLKWVGAVGSDELTEEDQTQLQIILKTKFNCYPIFFKRETLVRVQEDMYLKYLDLILNNIKVHMSLNIIQSSLKKIKEISLVFTNHILNLVDDSTVVFVSDYRLFYVNYYLAYAYSKLTTGLFWNNCFPALEYWKMLPFGNEFIKCFLCCSNISFQFYSHA